MGLVGYDDGADRASNDADVSIVPLANQTGPSLITYSPWQRSRETVLGLPYSLAKHFD